MGISKKLSVVVIGKTLVPYSSGDYEILAKSGIKTTRVNYAFLPTLKYIFPKMEIVEIPWNDVYNKAIKKTQSFWMSDASKKRKMGSNQNSLVFTAPNDESNKKSLKKLESSWRKFFNRWGFSSDIVYSEGNRIKLAITFLQSPNYKPEIPLTEEIDDIQPAILELPFVRFKLSLGEKYIEITEETSLGDGRWIPVKLHRALYSEVKSHSFIYKLFDALSRN